MSIEEEENRIIELTMAGKITDEQADKMMDSIKKQNDKELEEWSNENFT